MHRTAALLLAAFGTAAHAGDADSWNGSADLGYTALGGNSRAGTLVAGVQASGKQGAVTHHLEARATNTEESGTRTAEAYRIAGKEDLALTARDYLFLHAGWEKDLFSGYDWHLTTAAGYGRELLAGPRQFLSAEVGPGYRHDDLPGDDTTDSGTLHAALDYQWQATDTTRLRQRVDVDAGDDGTLSRALTELVAGISERLSLKASLELRRDSAPPAGLKNTDRTTLLSVAWQF